MKEGIIIFPLLDNDGETLEDIHDALQRILVDMFGGFTMQEGQGGWRNPATHRLHMDKVAIYSVATQDTPENRRALGTIAVVCGMLGEQDAVYVKDTQGRVSIIAPSETLPATEFAEMKREAQQLRTLLVANRPWWP